MGRLYMRTVALNRALSSAQCAVGPLDLSTVSLSLLYFKHIR